MKPVRSPLAAYKYAFGKGTLYSMRPIEGMKHRDIVNRVPIFSDEINLQRFGFVYV